MPNLEPCFRMSWRVGLGYSEDDDHFAELLRLIQQYREVVDEIAFFETCTHHLYIPLPEYEQRAALLGRRLDQLRAAGVPSVGINVLTTIGHLNEAWDYMPPLPFQPMVGHDGQESRGCACPNGPELRTYIGEKYRLTASVRPDFIWIDDDIRMQHHGVPWPCFCATCLGLFNERMGRSFTREELVVALDAPEGGELREAWVQQNCDTIVSLLGDVRAAIDDVDPGIVTGLMTADPAWSSYSGPDHARWYEALRATKSRPGGGYYADVPRTGAIGKAISVGRQRVAAPAFVTDCQYELENFPYQRLNKSSAAVMAECTLALAMGLNGIACNWLHMWGTTSEDTEPLMQAAQLARPVWEKLVAWTDGLPTVGMVQAFPPTFFARRSVRPGESWFGGMPDLTADLLALLGLPMAVDEPACGTILRGRLVECYCDKQLRKMLSGPLLMDSAALELLQDRGLHELTGVRLGKRRDNGLMEHFTADPLNGRFAGERRDARIEFWGDARGQADELEPLDANVRVLSVLETYHHTEHGPCLTACQNELGGRVAVMAYAPWMLSASAAKREQLLNLADWLTDGQLPVRVDPTVAVTPFVRLSADRTKGAVVLLNWGLDPVGNATLDLRLAQTRVRLLAGEAEHLLAPEETSTGFRVTLPRLEPFTTTCLLIG